MVQELTIFEQVFLFAALLMAIVSIWFGMEDAAKKGGLNDSNKT